MINEIRQAIVTFPGTYPGDSNSSLTDRAQRHQDIGIGAIAQVPAARMSATSPVCRRPSRHGW